MRAATVATGAAPNRWVRSVNWRRGWDSAHTVVRHNICWLVLQPALQRALRPRVAQSGSATVLRMPNRPQRASVGKMLQPESGLRRSALVGMGRGESAGRSPARIGDHVDVVRQPWRRTSISTDSPGGLTSRVRATAATGSTPVRLASSMAPRRTTGHGPAAPC